MYTKAYLYRRPTTVSIFSPFHDGDHLYFVVSKKLYEVVHFLIVRHFLTLPLVGQ